ncbi:hypothetical protein GCM10010967_16100 [Dyadobacter beijingensis]|uniref:Pentapeptide MXKDX repeat protein n=1 Tax=Dyadobacter beijingensis TaxID=365489 RepID=A0ABQ2HPW8_9BACT|nr:hypothetical protein [Dyadobacter beijingensis]GGM84957.1 hypothetical protein GCM10010967_16100 [Dyadobacter beijingensis]
MKNLKAWMLLAMMAVAAPMFAQTTPAEKQKTEAKLKKDGTPDKRYKENKHLKKDGTPDKRYKTNKADTTKAAKKK